MRFLTFIIVGLATRGLHTHSSHLNRRDMQEIS